MSKVLSKYVCDRNIQFITLSLSLLLLLLYMYHDQIRQPILSASIAGATSGTLFEGQKTKVFSGSRLLFQRNFPRINKATITRKHRCKKWSVVTTIFPPSGAVMKQARLNNSDWCMVIVFDKKGPPSYDLTQLTHDQRNRITCLDVKSQEDFGKQLGTNFVKMLPWNHVGRKNVGYLYAIGQGAETIWDFDDDNELIGTDLKIPEIIANKVMVSEVAHHKFSTFNPYPLMGAPHFPCWPRGLPLPHIKTPQCYNFTEKDTFRTAIPMSTVGVIQSLANHDPDVDAMYRISMPLSFNFTAKNTMVNVAVPINASSPLNAQATLFLNQSLWMLYLPVTVHGRVSDIWRGYIAQRLALDIEKRILFTAPLVRQNRNPHNILADFQSENDLYLRSESLVNILNNMTFRSKTMPGRIEDLWVELYSRQFVGEQDVLLVQEWIKTLLSLDYQFPVPLHISTSTENRTIENMLSANKAASINCNREWPDLELLLTMANSQMPEFRLQLLRTLLLFWQLQHLRMVTVLDEEGKNAEFEITLLNDTRFFNSSRIRYNSPTPYYNGKGHDRQQLIMFWADNFTDAEYIGFVDTDTLFITPVDVEDLFEDGKPVVIGMYGREKGWWDKVPQSTYTILKHKEAMRCMNYFPVILKTKHLQSLRNYIFNTHGKTINEVFHATMDKGNAYSQFNIMCNYVWYYHRHEYVWYIQEYNNGIKGVLTQYQPSTAAEAGFTPEMFYPKPRVAIHTNYHYIRPTETFLTGVLKIGYCYDAKAAKLKQESGRCEKVILDKLFVHLYQFELHDWGYHPKTQESFDKRQHRRKQCPHFWNLQLTLSNKTIEQILKF